MAVINVVLFNSRVKIVVRLEAWRPRRCMNQALIRCWIEWALGCNEYTLFPYAQRGNVRILNKIQSLFPALQGKRTCPNSTPTVSADRSLGKNSHRPPLGGAVGLAPSDLGQSHQKSILSQSTDIGTPTQQVASPPDFLQSHRFTAERRGPATDLRPGRSQMAPRSPGSAHFHPSHAWLTGEFPKVS